MRDVIVVGGGPAGFYAALLMGEEGLDVLWSSRNTRKSVPLSTGPLPRPKHWNVWWLLTILAAAVGVTTLILEGLGMFRDLGLVLTGISLFATLLFGVTAATRNAVSTLHLALSPLHGMLSAEPSALRTDLRTGPGRIEDLLRRRLP